MKNSTKFSINNSKNFSFIMMIIIKWIFSFTICICIFNMFLCHFYLNFYVCFLSCYKIQSFNLKKKKNLRLTMVLNFSNHKINY
uniref:Uncharacterized protein n=1 Tax=Brassica oleracea var. oleracea TaxID=109376 RepID=A0A0D2ZT99_BRAOL